MSELQQHTESDDFVSLPPEVLLQSDKCMKDHACMKQTRQAICKVRQSIAEDVLFVYCNEQEPCAYKMPFGFTSVICTCPARLEIFKKYGF